MFRQKAIFLFSILIFIQVGCVKTSTDLVWKEVRFNEQGYLVQCPQKNSTLDYFSINYDKKSKDGFLTCRNGGVLFHIHSMEWNVSDNAVENEQRFFDSLDSYGTAANQEINLKHKGKRGIQGPDTIFQSTSQHFVAGKIAYHLDVSFYDKITLNTKKGKLDENQLEIAQKYFDSFQIIE
ncbi:MAG TPA: hypothetical protein PKY59_24635 [Pyrinomonadaceae bacterium]|nr:hypothetical protein [Pyrinomonadaceae bacterium]